MKGYDVWAPVDCRLRNPDLTPLTFEFHDPGGRQSSGKLAARDITIRVEAAGRTIQTITQRGYRSWSRWPTVMDVDHDGRIELMVRSETGGRGGDGLQVWHEAAPGGTFVHAGALFGFTELISTTTEGFSAINAHGSAADSSYTVFRFVGDTLVKLFELYVGIYQADGKLIHPDIPQPTVRNRNVLCSLTKPTVEQANALQVVGVDPDTAASHFCHQAWVGETYS